MTWSLRGLRLLLTANVNTRNETNGVVCAAFNLEYFVGFAVTYYDVPDHLEVALEYNLVWRPFETRPAV